MPDNLPFPNNAAIEPKVGHAPNLGFLRRNWRGPSGAGRTLILTGIEPADGPLIIASVLRQLGVPVFFFPAGGALSSSPISLTGSGFRDAAKRLTQAHSTWAARVPFARNMATRSIDIVRNPHVVIVTEDVAATAISRERSDKGVESALLEAAEKSAELAIFATQTRAPSLIVSLQKAREFAQENVDAIAEFAGINPPPETRLAATLVLDQGVRSMRAPNLGRRAAQGALDKVQKPGGVIRGWAKFPQSGDRVPVRVLLDGQQIGEAICDDFREDLLPHNIGDGAHGLAFDVTKHLVGDQQRRFEVYALPEVTLLGVVEMSLKGGKTVV